MNSSHFFENITFNIGTLSIIVVVSHFTFVERMYVAEKTVNIECGDNELFGCEETSLPISVTTSYSNIMF